MASYGEGGHVGQKHHGSDDSYGNPVRQTDEYGNPIQHTTGGTMGDYGTGGLSGATGTHGTGATGTHGVGLSTGTGVTQHRRAGSSSSSSSEDDGEGGRRKKTIKEKIKEKLPGHKQEQQTPVIGGSYGNTGEQHHTGGYGTTATTGEHHQTGGYGATATGEQPHEKKGIMEKIKDVLPGSHSN